MIDAHHNWNLSFKPITLGFIFSLILTAAAYRIVTHYHLSNMVLTSAVVVLGCVQAVLQVIFYLHVGLEAKPHWNTVMFLFMVLLMVIVVGGSLWIMHNLGYNVMPSMEKFHQM